VDSGRTLRQRPDGRRDLVRELILDAVEDVLYGIKVGDDFGRGVANMRSDFAHVLRPDLIDLGHQRVLGLGEFHLEEVQPFLAHVVEEWGAAVIKSQYTLDVPGRGTYSVKGKS
jgi:hypothetical protein